MRTFPIIAILAIATVATPAAASQGPVNSTDFAASVDHDDLDLSTHDGVSRLDDRIRTRINQLCRNGGRDSASIRLERQCRESALEAASPDVRFAIAQANAERVRFATNTATPAADAIPGA